MLRFNKLRLSGFKSFVDPTDLHIDNGLTGIVGPNGCGKSNLVEALRWVMGETSARQMRGAGMEDVIFSGTATRPARNVAEVSLILDNSDRAAPATFNDREDLEVVRRIEREKGSNYKVNSREVRARDVQLLFADNATGARSAAMVSQGGIGAVIGAKPTERRALLEEAAGIAGLRGRRHEAELRLRGAESNLERLDDILTTLDVQFANLKKQSRQATRYRNLSDHIRKAEATLFHLRWRNAVRELGETEDLFRDAEDRAMELAQTAARASAERTRVAEGLPTRRRAEAEAAEALRRHIVAGEGLNEEERRVEAARRDKRERLSQLDADEAREKALARDAEAAILRFNEEARAIAAESEGADAAREDAARALETANGTVREMDAEVSELTTRIAGMEARRNGLARRIEDLGRRVANLTNRFQDLLAHKARAESEAPGSDEILTAEKTAAETKQVLRTARATAETAETERIEAQENGTEFERAATEARSTVDKLETEEHTLAKLLDDPDSELFPKLIDAIAVQHGYEMALGAALGEDLSAPADEPAPIHWRTLPPLDAPPALPDGAKPLSSVVRAPSALARRLSQIGVVETDGEGRRLCGALAVGQRLVGRDGALWRWDGFTVAAGAKTATAMRLEQRNRLVEIRSGIAAARTQFQAARRAADQAREIAKIKSETERAAREAAREAAQTSEAATDALNTLKHRSAELSSKLAATTEQAASARDDLEEARKRKTETEEELRGLPDIDAVKATLKRDRAILDERRRIQVERRADFDGLERAAADRERRLGSARIELKSWSERAEGAKSRIEELATRREILIKELNHLSAAPARIAEKRQTLLSIIEKSENRRKEKADALQTAENLLREAETAMRRAERELGQARENRIRSEGAVEQARRARESIRERVAEKLDCAPDDLFPMTGLNEDSELPEPEAVERKLARLNRERETMGPVNLRAEREAAEMNERLEGLRTEREDLTLAIEKLRKGIAELNRESRDRLLASFAKVDGRFQELFTRLFGGGKAMLKLTDAEDPLETGLEIMASPPGKRMQRLSLLSGGEQALTALSLLFAVFQTNPAPICVLDEVDAPLDDANVDRFCAMLEEMANSGIARFLVITHHRMTMSRMERLFGVTMSERGVSRLVSVDLERAEELRATP